MTNLDAARALAAAGLPVFPCLTEGQTPDGQPLHKRPLPGVMWRSAATTDAARIDALWSRADDAAPGVHLERSPYFVVDCDTPKGPGEAHGVDWFRATCEAHDFDLAQVPIVRTPRGGWHVYFRRPAGIRITNSRGSLPAKADCGLDIRGEGGYVLGAGAAIDIGTYELIDGPDIEAAPLPPGWLLDLLAPKAEATVAAPVYQHRAEVGGRQEAYARAGLDEECRIVAGTPAGGRNDQLNESAFKVGRMIGSGWIGYGEARGALVAAIAGWKDPKKTLGTLDRALRSGMSQPREALPDEPHDEAAAELARQVIEAHGVMMDAETGEILDETLASDASKEFPAEWMQVPGLVGEIADWIERTSPRPIRLFALASALTVVGSLVARQVYSGTPRTGTHLYTLMIAGTGGGKDWPQEAASRIISAVGRDSMIKGGRSSAASINLHLLHAPAQVHIIDEIASVLRKLNNSKSSNSETGMLEVYCTLWGRNTGEYRPEATTMRGDDVIARPWVSILGATTHSAFRDQMKSKNVANGFFNRFLVLPKFERVDWRDDIEPSDTVPDAIIQKARAIAAFDDAAGSHPQSTLYQNSRMGLPEIHVMDATPEAEAMLREARRRQEEKLRLSDDDPLYEIWVRSAEMIRRVALIVAVGRHPTTVRFARIGAEDVAFAERLVGWSMEAFQRELAENMADTQHQADMLHVLAIIRKARMITRRDLYQRLKGRFNKMTMESIIDALETSGSIFKQEGDRKEGGRGYKSTIYTYRSG